MPISLYEMTVPSYIQILGGLVGTLEAGLSHCKANGIDPDELAQVRLAPDMQPLSYQVFSAAYHSAGAIDTLQTGTFLPPSREPIPHYDQLLTIARDAHKKVCDVQPDDVNAYADGAVLFQTEKFSLKFTSLDFIHTFSFPNFYFHAATSYDLLRMKGVKLIKMNYLGSMRLLERTGI